MVILHCCNGVLYIMSLVVGVDVMQISRPGRQVGI